MASSMRMLISDEIESRLAEITEANGYNTQVGSSRVYPFFKVPSKLPRNSIIVYVGDESIEGPVSNDRYQCTLTVSIGFATTSSARDPYNAGELMMADIQTCMGRGFSSPDNTELTLSTNKYNDDSATTIIAEVLEQSNTITESNAMPGYVVGQVDYSVQYWRNMHRPDRI